jgi:hypothetical protein
MAAALLTAVALFAQAPPGGAQAPPGGAPRGSNLLPKAINAPDIPYESVPNFLKIPADKIGLMGEGIGIATNSKGHIFVNTCSQLTRLLEFDQNGNFVREIAQGLYGFVYCHSVRVDSQDNIWVVDEGSNMVIKFNPEGRVTLVIGRRPEMPITGVVPALPAADPAPPYVFNRPTDVAIDTAGNIFVTDGYVNARVAKYDKNGKFIKQVGHRGNQPGQFNLPHDLVVDKAGNVYVGSRSDQRIEVFDNDLNYKTTFDHVGAPWGLCITDGPHQYLFSSNANPDSNDTDVWKYTGQIFKMELDGTVLGKFGVTGKQLGQFSTVHDLDCRNENVVYGGEIVAWRVQKFLLHPTASQGGKK